jgi:predicted SAM-dependent methyltransferase
MIGQRKKDVYYFLTRILTFPNYYVAKLRFSWPAGPDGHYLHLGCGPKYIAGMINIDGNIFRKVDLWLDLRNGLPFRSGSVSFAYCRDTLEHFFPDEALQILRELRRVLRPDGVARIAVPSFEHALDIAAGKVEYQWPRESDDPLGQAINYLFCDGQHKYAYSFGVLSDFARQAGFHEVIPYSQRHACQPKKYGKIEVGNELEGSLIVELMP